MVRPISQKHIQALRSDLRRDVLLLTPQPSGTLADLHRLASAIRVDLDEGTASRRVALKNAANELGALLRGADQLEHQDGALPALDNWIDHRLLLRGTGLIIVEESRHALLSRQRDSARRRDRAMQGKHAARIEMREEAWERLRLIRAAFRVEGGAGLTRSQVLERLIDTQFVLLASGDASSERRKRDANGAEPSMKARKPAPAHSVDALAAGPAGQARLPPGDLLSPLNLAEDALASDRGNSSAPQLRTKDGS